MTSPDFSEGDEPMDIESFGDIMERWLALPSMVSLPVDQQQRVEALSHPEGEAVKQFRHEEYEAVSAFVKEGRHFDALRLLETDLVRIGELFQGDEAISAREMAYRQRAYAQEHLATFGAYSKFPSADPARRMMFREAAASYALSDLELGCKTDYFMRITESSFGAGFHELGNAILTEFLGPNFTAVEKKDTGARVAIRDMLRRATEVKTVEGSAGKVTSISGSMPDPSLN